ncbi:MAG: glycerophosphodiester phosphodiesterase [Bacilli bacterium]|nr:glycerophosphodiester phosphodiesterase [Bacilli bacterium]
MFKESYIIAHRGIHDNKQVYENTLEAFSLAINKGYIIELDVRLTKDQQIVVFHDENTKRITNQDLIIEESTYQELNQQDIIHIPLLEEVLNLVNGKVPILIEIKQFNTVGTLEAKLMSILNTYQGKYAIQSFNPKVLYWFKKHYPNILRGQLSYSFKNKKISSYKKFILSNMFLNFLTKPNFISYKYNEISPQKIKYYQKKNIPVLGWTITNKKDYNYYKKYYDNLICEKFI